MLFLYKDSWLEESVSAIIKTNSEQKHLTYVNHSSLTTTKLGCSIDRSHKDDFGIKKNNL